MCGYSFLAPSPCSKNAHFLRSGETLSLTAIYQIFDNCGFKDANKALTEDKETFEKAIKNLIENLNSQEHRKSKKCDFEM